MSERTRAETMTIRINTDEQAMVRALAEADGISVSDVVRMSIRRQHGERFGVKKAKVRR